MLQSLHTRASTANGFGAVETRDENKDRYLTEPSTGDFRTGGVLTSAVILGDPSVSYLGRCVLKFSDGPFMEVECDFGYRSIQRGIWDGCSCFRKLPLMPILTTVFH